MRWVSSYHFIEIFLAIKITNLDCCLLVLNVSSVLIKSSRTYIQVFHNQLQIACFIILPVGENVCEAEVLVILLAVQVQEVGHVDVGKAERVGLVPRSA